MKRIDPLGWAILIITAITVFSFFCISGASADGNVGFNYNRAVNDASWGLTGDWEYEIRPRVIFEVEGDLQSGDVYKGTTDLSISFGVIRFSSHNTFKGYDFSGIGRKNDLGVSLVKTFGDIEVAVGVSGRNGNPFAPQTALGALTAAGFGEEEFEGLGLENIKLSEGLSIKDGSSLLGSLETELDFNVANRDFELGIQALLEMAGEGERVHQVKANLGTNGELFGEFDWQAALTLEAQLYGDGDAGNIIEYETTWFIGLGYAF